MSNNPPIKVFVNYTPHPTFKLVHGLGGHLAPSKWILNPAPINNFLILEALQGETLILQDGIFMLTKFQSLGNYIFDVKLDKIVIDDERLKDN